MAFSKSFGESNPAKKCAVVDWVFTNIDCEQIRRGFPLCFYKNTSYFSTKLPNWRTYPEDFQKKLMDAIIDMDMLDDLQSRGLINWCRTVSTVIPIRVPKDGNCLLHAISVAVWGIMDDALILRRTLQVALRSDNGGRFYSRWARCRQEQLSHLVSRNLDSSMESLQREWQDVSGCLNPDRPCSVAVPHRFLEAIHVYTLANILRRPIIVLTDSTVRAFSGLSLQDNDMGGIYLPLEWEWNNTSKTPVLIAYAQNHFCPLLFADHPQQSVSPGTHRKNLAPIVTDRLEQLPVRFLLRGEEPEVWELLKKYLKVRETVMTLDSTIQNILCAEFETSSLPEDLNLVAEYFRDCEHRYGQLQSTQLGQQSPILYQAVIPQQQASQAIAFECLQQTGNHHQPAGSPQHRRGGPQPKNLWHFGRQLSVPLDIPPPNVFPPQRLYQEQRQEVSLNPPPSRKCIVPICNFFGDPAQGMMCSSCFKDYTIIESLQKAAALEYERQQPTAPMHSIGAEQGEPYLSSMMPERCKTGCGYRASRYTRPYCHECKERLQREAQRKEERSEASAAGAAAGTVAPVGTTSASATDLVHPAPPAVAQAGASASRNPMLEPFITPPVSGQARTNTAQQEDLIQFPSLLGKAKSNSPAVTSPTEVLLNINMTAPLTPPDDTNDRALFGNGEDSPTSGQPAVTTNTQTPASAGNQNAATVAGTNMNMNNLSGHSRTSPSATQCITEGCFEEVVQNGRCGKCYIGMGLKQTNTGPGSVISAPGQSIANPRPSHTYNEEMENPLRLQNKSPASSMPRPPNSQLPLNTSMTYVSTWVNSSRQQVAGQSMGLPERQSSDDLGERDLVASGEACHVTGIECVSQVCHNIVTQPGQLCQSCQNILRSLIGGQASAQAQGQQESLTGEKQKCLQEGCTYFGTQQTLGYCSDHYNKAFRNQLAKEVHFSHPANLSHTVPLARNQQFVNMTPELRPLTVPQTRRGTKCVKAGCTFFGDPKQKDMCGKHYQEYITCIASGSNIRVPFSGSVSAPYVQSASVMPPSPRVMTAVGEMGGVANYIQGAVSVPPPSFPISESCTQESSITQPVVVISGISGARSFDETYIRVATRNVKHCVTPGCINYGNNSKGGLCNSCFERSEAVKHAILGEEECG